MRCAASPGVADARQYTIPVPAALDAVRAGDNPQLTTRQKHTRECWVVLEEGADAQAVEKQIVEMPNYFDEYDVTVNFISQEELDRDHAGAARRLRHPHGHHGRRQRLPVSSTRSTWAPTPSSPPACWCPTLARSRAWPPRVQRAARPCSTSRPLTSRP